MQLNEKEKALYDALSLNDDTPIVDLFVLLYPGRPAPSLREQQQQVGTYVSRVNKKLEKQAIQPGVSRASYRLYFAA